MDRYAITFKGMDRLDTFDQEGAKGHIAEAMYSMLRDMNEDDTPADPRHLISWLGLGTSEENRVAGARAFTMMRSAGYVEVV